MSKTISPEEMPGKTYLYMGTEYRVEEVRKDEDGTYRILTNKRPLKVKAADLGNFMPVGNADESAEEKGLVLASLNGSKQIFKDLSVALADNIEKIQKDPKYIPQAKAINETAKTLTNLMRLQIDAVKMMKGSR